MLPPEDQEQLSFQERVRQWLKKRGIVYPVIGLLSLGALAGISYSFQGSPPPPVSITQSAPRLTPGVATAVPAGNAGYGGEIRVYIVGAIRKPGVYRLYPGDRIEDLVRQAGGLTVEADARAVNLAAKVVDGQEVYVPRRGEAVSTGTSAAPSGSPVNINSASAEELKASLPISLVTARRIVAYRTTHGPFSSVQNLTRVLSPATFAKIKDLVTV